MEVRDASRALLWRGRWEWRRRDEGQRRVGDRRLDEDRLEYEGRLELQLLARAQQRLQTRWVQGHGRLRQVLGFEEEFERGREERQRWGRELRGRDVGT